MTVIKKALKVVLIIIVAIVSFYVLFYMSILGSLSSVKRYDDVKDFEDVIDDVHSANNHIPNVEQLGDYESVELAYKETKYLLWKVDALTLTVRYGKVEFEEALKQIDLNYSFLKETKEYLLDYCAIIDGYEIKVVNKTERMDDDYSYCYPKCFMMIAFNQKEKSIVYMYHYDIDLDEIKDLDEFIEKYYALE